MLITRAMAIALTPAAAFAQCGEWDRVVTPNPSDVINVFTAADSSSEALHALLIADDSFTVGNPVTPHVFRRDSGGWTDLGGPGLGGLEEPVYFALHASEGGPIWIGGVSGDDRALQDLPVVARYDGDWSVPQEIRMADQPLYPFHDRGGKIFAMDTAPDGTMFAVGIAKNYGLTDDNSVPLFLVNRGVGWIEATRPETDWPGSFSGDTYLTDVVAFSADDVWAVGWHAEEEEVHPIGGMIVHWDGSSLSIVEGPGASGAFLGHPLQAMAARGPDDISAVGGYVFAPQTSTIAHYDGARWRRIESPVANPLRSLALADDGTAWAAPANPGAEVAYFDGAQWSAAAAPDADALIQTMATDPDGALWSLGQTTEAKSLALTLNCACAPDLDGDGELTFFDFLEFQDLFAAGDLTADFDGSGALDFFDFLAFQNAFAAGCR